jgi:hypothetical protein
MPNCLDSLQNLILLFLLFELPPVLSGGTKFLSNFRALAKQMHLAKVAHYLFSLYKSMFKITSTN